MDTSDNVRSENVSANKMTQQCKTVPAPSLLLAINYRGSYNQNIKGITAIEVFAR